jgi:hypothetical protein
VFTTLGNRPAAGRATPGGGGSAGSGGGVAAPVEARCAVVAKPSPSGKSGTFTLSRRQLQINQRISQAAVRRSNSVHEWLDAKVATRDLCGGGLRAANFGEGVTTRRTTEVPPQPTASPRPLVSGSRSGSRGTVRLSAGQLLINQRISQAAVRRSNALLARLRGGLTGGDLRDGAVTKGQLERGLDIARATPTASPPAPSRTVVARGRRSGARVTLSLAQLRINQRISQAAVRRANALQVKLRTGLTGADFRPDSITARNLSSELRGGA